MTWKVAKMCHFVLFASALDSIPSALNFIADAFALITSALAFKADGFALISDGLTLKADGMGFKADDFGIAAVVLVEIEVGNVITVNELCFKT